MKHYKIALMLCEAEESAKRMIQQGEPLNALQMLELIYALEEKLLGAEEKEYATQKQAENSVPA